MPYIPEEKRRKMDAGGQAINAGELNYAISRLIGEYILFNGLGYAEMNDVLGALDGAGKEFYRRVVVPYEDVKRADNGDVYPEQILPPAPEPLARILRQGPLAVTGVRSGVMRDPETGTRLVWNGDEYVEVEG